MKVRSKFSEPIHPGRTLDDPRNSRSKSINILGTQPPTKGFRPTSKLILRDRADRSLSIQKSSSSSIMTIRGPSTSPTARKDQSQACQDSRPLQCQCYINSLWWLVGMLQSSMPSHLEKIYRTRCASLDNLERLFDLLSFVSLVYCTSKCDQCSIVLLFFRSSSPQLVDDLSCSSSEQAVETWILDLIGL